MEHMHQDLQSYLEDGVNNSLVLSNLPIAMDMMLQIVGMQSVHQNGITHRNFKSPHALFNYPSQDEEMAKIGYKPKYHFVAYRISLTLMAFHFLTCNTTWGQQDG
jgi:hypothetical protein